MSDLKQLAGLQFIVVYVSIMIGVGIILMPRSLAEAVNAPNLWLSIVWGFLLIGLCSMIIVQLVSRYPGKTFFEMSTIITGKYIGFLLNLCYIVYTLIVSAYILRVTGGIVKSNLLDTTPLSVVIGTFIIVSTYLITNGAGDIVRFFQLYFPVMIVTFVALCLLSLKDVDINNIRPVVGEGIMPTFQGIRVTFFSFLGFEFLLIFSKLLGKRSANKLRAGIWISLALTAIIYIGFHLLSLGILGLEELKQITFPTVEMAKSIEFQGFFFERFEILFLVGWLITAITSFSAYYYAMWTGVRQTFHTKSKFFVWLVAVLIFATAIFPPGLTEVFQYSRIVNFSSIIAIVLFPTILLLVSLSRRQSYAK
ncbi:GerAB/ArcD/ProY family transporter [Halobacillus mangrovi]|uniref:GerAB/ArcD/ProY family transporter n=1 Tax=Halobacillus mangrovi TaxID=402384 RepID=UPI003D981033